MEINIAEIKEIADTLPIGYYAKRRVSMEFSKEAMTSSYSPIEDKVTFAYDNIITALNNAEDMDKELAIRSVLYHEISHAILTPSFSSFPDWFNIFEDERIETLLKNYYMNTDFNALLHAISPYDGGEITSAIQAFFLLCRYRIGKREFLEEVENIIRQYAFLSAQTYGYCEADCYRWTVGDLWRQVKKDYETNPQDYKDGNFESYTATSYTPNTAIYETESDTAKGITAEEKKNIDVSKNCNGNEKVTEQIDGQREKGETENSDESAENGEEKCSNENAKDGEETEDFEPARGGLGDRIFSSALGFVTDTSLTEKLSAIFSTFSKKNGSGNGTTGHSGVLNPRYCGNDDYRFFERKLETRGNNRFGSMHLNLFIDVSGSFFYSKSVVNRLLCSLCAIERKNHNFTFDVVHCEVGEELKEKKDCLINPFGGNRVSENFPKLFRQLQKPMTFNYNIILFDGECCPCREDIFNCADRNNTTIISDKDNERYFKKLKNARVIITKEYTDELYTHVFNSLQKAFR